MATANSLVVTNQPLIGRGGAIAWSFGQLIKQINNMKCTPKPVPTIAAMIKALHGLLFISAFCFAFWLQ